MQAAAVGQAARRRPVLWLCSVSQRTLLENDEFFSRQISLAAFFSHFSPGALSFGRISDGLDFARLAGTEEWMNSYPSQDTAPVQHSHALPATPTDGETGEQSRNQRGFAAMNPERQREIARKGGKAAHEKGTAHKFTSEEARNAGRKGGEAVSKDREHMASIGREGGKSRNARIREGREGREGQDDQAIQVTGGQLA